VADTRLLLTLEFPPDEETKKLAEDLVSNPLITINAREAEALSEKAQKAEGAFG